MFVISFSFSLLVVSAECATDCLALVFAAPGRAFRRFKVGIST